MAYSTNSITNYAKAGSSSVSCNVIKLEDAAQEALVKGDEVSLQAVSTGSDAALTGTVSSTGTALVGTTTAFDTELKVGDVIYDGSGEFRKVDSITDATNATISSAFTVDLSGATVTVKVGAIVREVAAPLDTIGILHFTKNLRQDLDPTDTAIQKLG